LLVTGLALIGMGTSIRDLDIAEPAMGSGSRAALVRDFYDAANEVLATGDRAPLEAVVAPNLVEHQARFGSVQGRADLIRVLLSWRMTFPSLRLVVEDLRPSEPGLVTARVRVEGATAGSFLGLPIPAAFADWGPLDLFRIADGQVVEHWGSRSDSLLALPVEQLSPAVAPHAPARTLVVSRSRLAPGAEVSIGWIETTELLVLASGTADVIAGVASPRSLSPGEVVVLPPSARLTLRGGGTTAAVVLTVAFWPLDPSRPSVGVNGVGGGPGQRPGPAGTPTDERPERRAALQRPASATPASSVQVNLATSVDVVAFADAARVASGRAVLAANTVLSIPAGERLLLVAVEEGRLEIVTSSTGTATQTTLAGGGATILKMGASSTLRSGEDGPTMLVLFAISPLAEGSPESRA
jgi:predicted ester cyclase